ncbi:Preprotein translocase band 1 subunit [Variovorax sp. PBS-H4]|uniref:preprotein translocase subunit SecG n=1 Tax=Variovorax sp. PBS-H4 TaxID=434008 RepID=UPI0013176CBE|nr:preprotein translocase subunit SecG [Variovorax sp. PBS-H4]VTU30209.1 Preprotein translocase band 1 subunit [Variovorax sp. PBS-H4]
MNVVLNILVGVQMLAALAMIGLILIQHGKGADMGAAFGSGSAGSLFGASGSANFLSRTTGVLAAVFFACTLLLAYFSHARPTGGGSLLERAAVGAPAPAPAPAASGPASQIPSGNAQVAPAAGAPAPATPASGATQIPTK